jgi:hypothetical protein
VFRLLVRPNARTEMVCNVRPRAVRQDRDHIRTTAAPETKASGSDHAFDVTAAPCP